MIERRGKNKTKSKIWLISNILFLFFRDLSNPHLNPPVTRMMLFKSDSFFLI